MLDVQFLRFNRMKPSIHLLSLGCAKNLVDSEVMLGALLKAGHALESDPAQADVVIVNTCGFVEGSKQESIDAILQAASRSRSGGINPNQKLVVAGCLAQRYSKDLQKEMPEVDAFIGINEVPRIHEIIEELDGQMPSSFAEATADRDARCQISEYGRQNEKREIGKDKKRETEGGIQNSEFSIQNPQSFVTRKPVYLYDFATPRYQLTPSHFAYLKIGEGCNHPCAFCSIPAMRGRHRSRALEDVVAEARSLVGAGVRELCLISQDTTWFGRDLDVTDGLSHLLRRLNAIEGDFWIRILYTHPAHWNERLMEAIASCPKVCRYVDMPLQHIHDDLLLRMRRETSRAHIERIITRLREIVPGIAIRTTFIAGFPGETETHFQSLLEFVEQTRFERLGVFEYSREDGTVAGRMAGQITPSVKKERRERLMAAQQKISSQIMAAQVGRTLRVLVEKSGDPDASARSGNGKGLVGRTEFDAPDIDGRVLLRGKGWRSGEFQQARIVDSTSYDLVAKRGK